MADLTQDDLHVLKAHFELEEHEFDYGGNAYIKELPITERIESVDPAWQFEIRSITTRPSAGDNGKEVGTVTVHAALTIRGATRENTGMATILRSDEKEEKVWNNETRRKEPTGVKYTIEVNQAEKSATTDALKRCARLFGIGRYMLMFGNDVKDMNSLKRWLDSHRQTVQMPQEQATDEITLVGIRETENKSSRYAVLNGITLFSRQPLRDLGYTEAWLTEKPEPLGMHNLPDPVRIAYAQVNGYKQALRINRPATGETVTIKTNEELMNDA